MLYDNLKNNITSMNEFNHRDSEKKNRNYIPVRGNNVSIKFIVKENQILFLYGNFEKMNIFLNI